MSGLPLARDMFQAKMKGLMRISEAMGNGDWFKGTLVTDPSVVVEIGYDDAGKKLPGTGISYMGAWRGKAKRPLVEFQNGFLAYHPTADEWDILFRPIIERLMGFRPMRVAGDMRDVERVVTRHSSHF